MKSALFNDNWFVRHTDEDGRGTPVTLPHDAMLAEPRSATAEGGQHITGGAASEKGNTIT